MPTDVIISAFASPPQRKFRPIAQPIEVLREHPLIVDVNGIGSDQFLGPNDTERKPREPWGGAPFSREAARYRDPRDGSILRKLLAQRARGIDVRRVALIGFSAGGTFVHNVLDSDVDRKNVDAVILLDALHVAKLANGQLAPGELAPWVELAYRAMRLDEPLQQPIAGLGITPEEIQKQFEQSLALLKQGLSLYRAPLFVSAHTHIKQSAAIEKLVGNTTDSTAAVRQAASARLTGPRLQITPPDLTANVPGLPVTIGKPQGVPPPDKTWTSMPKPTIHQIGNFWDLDYGGTGPADHVFQAWFVQHVIWRGLLAPRWNARAGIGGTRVAGLEGFQLPTATLPGGNVVPPGTYPTGPAWWQMALAFGAGAFIGKKLMED